MLLAVPELLSPLEAGLCNDCGCDDVDSEAEERCPPTPTL